MSNKTKSAVTAPEFTKDNTFPLEVIDAEKGIVEGYASVYGVVDAQNEVVDRGAFDHILNDPIAVKKIKFVWQHQYDKPIGKLLKLWDDPTGLKYRAKYNLNTSWGKDAYYASEEENIDGNSIGYDMRNGKGIESKDSEGVNHLLKVGLREISNVTFPANEEAVHTEVKSEQGPEAVKTLIPYKKTPLADEGMAWDGPAQVAAASVEQLRQMCACIDGDPTNKTSYKLPHHTTSGSCVWAGVTAAYAATQGSRGGVQGCNGAEAHLLKHYDDFGKDRPTGKSMDTEDDLETKAGRVLSGVNMDDITSLRDALSQGVKLCDTVLGRAAPKEPAAAEAAAPGKSVISQTDENSGTKENDEYLIQKFNRLSELLGAH